MNLAESLGYPSHTKLLMIHADDAGLCTSENRATQSVLESQNVNSFSLMAPCSGFDEMAEYTRINLQFDHGIHLCFTCEWESHRFGPVLPLKEVKSLVDENGHFYKNRELFSLNTQIKDLEKEMRAQIEKVLSYGLNPSHIDCHMYSVGTKPEFLELYIKIGREYKLPVFLNKKLIDHFSKNKVRSQLVDHEFLIDHVYLGEYEDYQKGELTFFYENTLKNLKPGINLILIHPAFDNKEMQEISINHPNFGAAWRQLDHDFFSGSFCRNLIRNNEIKMITWRDIKEFLYPSTN